VIVAALGAAIGRRACRIAAGSADRVEVVLSRRASEPRAHIVIDRV
jgi:hypothetical protein